MTYGSFYEITKPLTKVKGQHMTEHFAGQNFTPRWYGDAHGGGSISMADGIDGGINLVTNTGNNSRLAFTFGTNNSTGVYPFSPLGSCIIWIVKCNGNGSTGNGQMMGFWGDTPASTSEGNSATCKNDAAEGSYINLFTKGSGQGNTNTDIPYDILNNWFTVKIELRESDARLYLNGMLKAMRTGNLPLTKVMPYIQAITRSGGTSGTTGIRYCEAWNT